MDSTVGTLIGPYRVTRPIGHGGMGSVFEATHQQIGRRVAIKILLQEHARDKETVTRLFNEARAVNRIEHPGLVQIFDSDQLPDGRAYLVMEFLQGETLTQRLKSAGGKLTGIDSVRIAHQLSSILTATHAGNIVHRDLKPSNIMLVKDPDVPGGERVKLLDFGIAKLAPEGAEDPGLTRPGVVFGTPTYMSPEQCKGAREVDGRSDVYSLGVILYQMLSGRPPFIGEGVGVVVMHMHEEPQPIEQLVPTLSRTVAQLVMSMLAKKRDDRPTMEQVASTLKPRAATDLYSSSANMDVPPGYTGMLPIQTISQEQLASVVSQPSTLGRIAIGQQVGPQPGSARRLPLVLGTALGVLLLIGSGVLTLYFINGQPQQTAKIPQVRWSVTTEPAGAAVIRTEDGRILGRTPWSQEQSSGSGELHVRLSKSDYKPQELTLQRNRSQNVDLRLELDAPVVSAEDVAGDKPGAGSKPKTPPAAGSKTVKPVKPANASTSTPGKPSQNADSRVKVVDD